MSDRSSNPINFPIDSLGRILKQKPNYLLGLYGVTCEREAKAGAASDLRTAVGSFWPMCVERLTDSMANKWGRTLTMVSHHELLANSNEGASQRTRYSDAEFISRWKSRPLCILDLGYDNPQQVLKYGRQCDGVAMLVLGDFKFARKQLRQLRREAIPWIGYWTVAFNTPSEENSALELVHAAA